MLSPEKYSGLFCIFAKHYGIKANTAFKVITKTFASTNSVNEIVAVAYGCS